MSHSEDESHDLGARSAEREGVHLEAHASGRAEVKQAGRDLHVHYGDSAHGAWRTEPGTGASVCPYPGLAAFEREQTRWFFGRDGLVAELIGCLDERTRTGGVQVVVAPSGAGKSSLLRAGLLPKLAQGGLPGSARWPTLSFTPTAEPLHALAAAIGSLIDDDSAGVAEGLVADPDRCVPVLRAALRSDARVEDGRVVLVVDQLEELFTLCSDFGQRRTFVDLLAQIASADANTGLVGLVVVGVRADFYSACIDYPQLRAALRDSPVVVGPMSDRELREAIQYPAQDVGLEIEPGLVELLLRDLGADSDVGVDGTAGYVAGRLPLLAHALRTSWQQRNGSTLTVQGYRTMGGLSQVVATTAGQVFDGLDTAAQQVARSLFLRLVKIGDGTQDTRRRQSYAELIRTSADPQRAAKVIDSFTQARLLTQAQDSVEITHEALLNSWPQLRRWIDTDRAGRLIHQDLEDAATAWKDGRRDPSLLYRGNRLENAHRWTETAPQSDLSVVAGAFLTASLQHGRRSTWIRRATRAALAFLSVFAVAAATIAVSQQREAREQQRIAIARSLVNQADALGGTSELSLRLKIAADKIWHAPEITTSLIGTLLVPNGGTGGRQIGMLLDAAFSSDGNTVARSYADGVVAVERYNGPVADFSVDDSGNRTPETVALSADGHLLASGLSDGTVTLWDITDYKRPSLIRTLIVGSPENAVTAEIAFSPDSRMLAASDGSTDEHKMTLWDIADPRQTYPIGYLPTRAGVTSIAFAPDGRTLVAGIWDKAELLRWDITDRAQVRNLEPLTVDRSRRVFVAEVFSPDGRLLATAVDGATVILWRISGPGRVEMIEELSGHAEGAEAIAFSPDGHTLATGGIDGTVVLWDITDSREPSRLGRMKTSPVLALTLRSEGEELVTSTSDDYVNQWDLTELSTLRDHAVELACQEVGRGLTPDEWAQFAPSLPYEQTCV